MKSVNEEDRIEMSAAEAEFIDRFVAAHCRPHAQVMAERLQRFVASRQLALFDAVEDAGFALAAGPSSRVEPSAVKAPDEPVTFVFASEGDAGTASAWRAEFTVPPGATFDTPVPLKVAGRELDDGVFTLSGCAVPLVDGGAEIPFGLFLAGIKDTDVTLCRKNGATVAGRLLFF